MLDSSITAFAIGRSILSARVQSSHSSWRSETHRWRRLLAATASLAVAGSGLSTLAAPAAAAPVTPTAECTPVNPMGAATPTGSTEGYTLFVKEDAILANSELEGTLAVEIGRAHV